MTQTQQNPKGEGGRRERGCEGAGRRMRLERRKSTGQM